MENTEFTLVEKTCMSKSHVKNIIVCFFDNKGIVHNEFSAQRQTAYQQYYLEVLTRLRKFVRRKIPGLWPHKWILHHDNDLGHDTLRFRDLLAKNPIIKMDHRRY
jgi:hypothetical protein